MLRWADPVFDMNIQETGHFIQWKIGTNGDYGDYSNNNDNFDKIDDYALSFRTGWYFLTRCVQVKDGAVYF